MVYWLSTGCHLWVTPCAIRRPPVRSVSALNCLAGFSHGSGASPITRSKRSMSAATPAVGSSGSKCGGGAVSSAASVLGRGGRRCTYRAEGGVTTRRGDRLGLAAGDSSSLGGVEAT